MGIAVIPEGGALEDLRQARDAFADLSPLLVQTVRIWAELDFLLNAPEPDILPPDTVEEYRSTRRWLGRFFPSASQVTLRTLTANEKGLSNFEITTPVDRYVLSVRTQSIPAGEGYSEPRVVLAGLPNEAEFRLEDINTGVFFPWEVDAAYPGSYLNGTTDRWRNPDGIERWAIKPGARKGDAQLFRLISAQLTPSRLEALLTSPRPIDSSQIQAFRRSDTNRQHHFLKGDPTSADVFTSPSRTGRGQVLTVAFPSRNAGFYLHDPSAAPYRLEGVEAVTRGTDQRGVRFHVQTQSATMLLPRSRILLDSVRAIREEDSRFDNGARGVMLKEFAESVHALPRDVQEQLRDGISLDEIRLKAQPVVRQAKNGVDQRIYIFRRTIDGYLYLAELIFPSSARIEIDAENIRVSSGGGEPLVWEGVVTSDAPELHRLPPEELFTPEALAWGARDPKFRHRLEEVAFLFSQEFVAAGSHRFLQFFSRDTLIWLRLFSHALTPQAHQRVLQGILDRISPEGRLPTVGEIGDQVSFELIEAFCWACRNARITGNYRQVVDAGRALQDYAAGKGPVEHLKYGVPDVDYLFLPALLDFLHRPDVTPEQKVQFLESTSRSGAGNITVLFHNLDRVVQRAQTYWESQSQRRHWLTALATIEDPQNRRGFGNWRDVEYGLGGGIYPSDVNRELIPLALDSSRQILKNVAELPLGTAGRQELQAAAGRQSHQQDLELLLAAWRGLGSRFSLDLPSEQIKLRLIEYMKGGPVTPAEREWFLSQSLGHGITVRDFTRSGAVPPVLEGAVSYFPVSLDAQGNPSAVISNDAIFGLFDPTLDPSRLAQILTPLLLPYPAGLLTPAGVLSASPVFSTDRGQWYQITNRAYGGSVIYGWQTEYLREGLIRQIQRFSATPELAATHRELLNVLYSALYVCCEKPMLEETAGEELRTWRVDETGRFRASFFGGPTDNDETNVVQLWNESAAVLHGGRLDQIAREQGLQRMEGGVLLDALARVRNHYPVQRVPEVRPNLLPRVGIVSYSALGGGGVNIVVEDQYTMLRLAGYPVKLMIGQSLSKERGERTARDLGINLQIIPELDVKSEIETFFRDRPGQQPHDFRSRVEGLKARLRQEFQDLDVVLIHQAMALFGNPILTVALDELSREPGVMGRVRFISWIHNVDPSSAQVGWPKSILAQHPLMETVAVSPQEGRRAAQLYGVDPTLVGTVGNGRSAITWADFSPKTLKFFLDHRLQDAEVLCFYPSRMEPTKNLEAAIWAVHEAVTYQNLDVRFVIATTAFLGPDGEEHLPSGGREGDYLNTLRALIHQLGLSDRVLIYPHTGNPKEIRTWYQVSDMHLFTSQTETFGITILEAMLLGKPFIRVDLPETSRLAGGQDLLTFQKQKFGESTEGYGKWIGLEMTRLYRNNPALLNISRLQKTALVRNSAEALFFGLVDPLLRVPVPAERTVRASARNFPHGWDYPNGGGSVQQAMRQTADAGYFGFEVNFEGFTPGDFLADFHAVDEVRRIAQERGLRLSLRLPDISRMDLSDPQTEARARTILQDAVRFALQTHASEIAVKLNRLDEKSRDLLIEIASRFLPAEQKRMHESPPVLMAVENITGTDEVLTPETLNRAFEGSPVGVSLWFDRLEDPVSYAVATHLKPVNLYVGEVFWSQSDSLKVDRLGGFLRWLISNRWGGSVLSQKPSQGPGDFMGERLVLDHVVTTAYMPAEAVKAFQTGDIMNPPVIPAILTDPRTGLEETALGTMESAYQTHSVPDLVLGVRRAADLRQPVAVLFDPRLVPGGSAAERQVNLVGLAGSLRAAFTWPDDVPLELGLLSERAGLEERGYRIVEVVPHPESLNAALPQAALPVVVAEALAAAGNRFLVNVGSYSGLEEVTLPEILGVLTNRFA